MIARMILALLLAAFALPVMASVPCHDGSTGMAGISAPKMHHDAPPPARDYDQKAVAPHACMGCIPPSSLVRHMVAARQPLGDVRQPMAVIRFDSGLKPQPDTPPPRAGA